MSRRICKGLLLIWFFTGSCAAVFAQRHHLYNDTSLYSVYRLLQNEDKVIPVLHLGDSHVQAGFFPDAVKDALQAAFGDAGQGWVFPYNLAGTNGPDGYRWSSNMRWNGDRVVDRNAREWPGPGGIMINKQPGPALLTFSGKPLKCMKLWYEGGESLPEAGNMPAYEDGSLEEAKGVRICADSAVSSLRVSFPSVSRFYGAVAESGEPGILYHSIGINGAQFSHYNQFDGKITAAQMQILQPALVIISLGTNEAFGAVSATQLRQEIGKMMEIMKGLSPETRFLFTTPPSGMLKKRQVPYRKKGKKRTYYRVSYVKVPQATTLRDAMITLCNENGWAYWDLYGAMKADARFARAWSGDHVHFNAYGYTLQGKLLAEAMLASYEQWNKQQSKP
ncbi:GDSL-type esterase/lipase family protein [Chitinophaga sp. 22620]